VEGSATFSEADAFRRALEALARALSRSSVDRYRFASSSHAGIEYELTIDGADVICNCPGFEYRGQCRHARDLKAALTAGLGVPAGYTPHSSWRATIGSTRKARRAGTNPASAEVASITIIATIVVDGILAWRSMRTA